MPFKNAIRFTLIFLTFSISYFPQRAYNSSTLSYYKLVQIFNVGGDLHMRIPDLTTVQFVLKFNGGNGITVFDIKMYGFTQPPAAYFICHTFNIYS